MHPFLGEVSINEGRNPEDESRKWPRVSLCLGPIAPLWWPVGKTLAWDPGLPLHLQRHCPSGCPLDPGSGSALSQCMLPWWILCLLRAQVSIERNAKDYWIHSAHWAKSKYCFGTKVGNKPPLFSVLQMSVCTHYFCVPSFSSVPTPTRLLSPSFHWKSSD